MSIIEECQSLDVKLTQILTLLNESRSRSELLLESEFFELIYEINSILEILNEGSEWFRVVLQDIEYLQTLIGTHNFLATTSLLQPTIKAGLASSDASILYSNSDSNQAITDLKRNPASSYYRKPPIRKMQGDIGELSIFKMLFSPEETENLTEDDIQVKPRINGTRLRPDFYIPSRKLICDAKAYSAKSIKGNWNKLKKTAHDYADLLEDGGEVRLYFPKDAYSESKTVLEKLESQSNSVVIRTLPMSEEYTALVQHRELIYFWLKSLLKKSQKNDRF